MIQISESAQSHFRRLIEREALPGLGVRLSAMHPGTPRADVRLEFAEPADLQGDEWAVDCEGFTLWLDAGSVQYLDGAEIDYTQQATSSQLQIRAPKIKGVTPGESASLVERVHWVVQNEVNPQLASHGGHVSVQEVSAEGLVLLRADPESLAKLPVAEGGSPSDHIYLIDPLGNLMMRFPKDADPSRMKKDLAKLLRASRVG